MNIVIPMAGAGQRFRDAGYPDPKPMIDVRGRPMYSWAVDSLPLNLANRLIFVCLREHLEGRRLEQDIATRYGHLDTVVIPLDRITDGQAATVLEARAHIDNDEGLLIYNADTYCRTSLDETLGALPADVDGVLGVFQAAGEHWSFARVDEGGRVVATAEKQRISEWASTGLYHFSRGRDFVRHADAMIEDDDRTRGEFYVIPVYNRMIAEGAHLILDAAHDVWVLGTPPELARFEAEFPSTDPAAGA